MKTNRTLSSLALLAVVVFSQSTTRADIMHMDVVAPSVVFTNISEGSPTGDPLPLYGQPFASGDQLVFTPTANFSAVSTSGGPANQTDGKLHVIVDAKPGVFIDALAFNEVGLTILNAPFGGDAFTSVIAFAEITVLEVNNVGVAVAPTTHFFNFAPDSSFLHSADATGPSFATAWNGSLMVPLPQKVTKVLLTVDNHLYAATVGVGTGALIDKKGFTINIVPTGTPQDVPEPAAAILAIIGLSGMMLRRRG